MTFLQIFSLICAIAGLILGTISMAMSLRK
jgi:hypothetical protein